VSFPLETVHQRDALVAVLAAALAVPDQAGLPLADALAAALAQAPAPLVLDGAEHLRDAVAALAARLLGAAAGTRIVVTSRVVLGAPGEVCWTGAGLQPGRRPRARGR
jgi:non-specific serine/threonine protein kinase